MSWEDKIEVKKGDLGEALVDEYIISKGVVPYKPDANQAHPFDRLCASKDKKSLYIAEVKTKAKRKNYPDTGINASHFNGYIDIQDKYGIRVFMFFVDEEMGMIYGGDLDYISKKHSVSHNGKILKYPMLWGEQIYFPIELMKDIIKIREESIKELKSLTTKKEEYRK